MVGDFTGEPVSLPNSSYMLFFHLQDLQQHFIYCHILPHHQGKALFCLIQKVKKTSYIRISSRRTPGSEISVLIVIILFIQQNDDLLLRSHRLDTRLPGSLFCPLLKSLSCKIIQKLSASLSLLAYITTICGYHLELLFSGRCTIFWIKEESSALVRIRLVRWNF